ncbi:MAG: isoprenylcysteine carboxylmethyltransferase family protein [bacterium]|nr:isoprenylcysteine carboxylmethyltransferase family protein [bacterium]
MLFPKERIRIYAAWLAAIFLFASSRNAKISWWAIAFALIGVIIRTWACGYLQKNKSVIASGPYQYTRNPLYLGSFIIGLGFFLAVQNILVVLLLAVIFSYIYYPVILDEERILGEIFGDEFKRYMAQVPRMIPNLTLKPFSEEKTKFSWENVFKNKEYNAWLGYLLALGLIFLIRIL